MEVFRSSSQTALGYQDRGHTFSGLTVLGDGACLSAERGGGRRFDEKGLVVRYENPFTQIAPPTVLYTGPRARCRADSSAMDRTSIWRG